MELKLTDYQQSLFNEHVSHKWAMKVGHKTTVVVIRLHNGFEIVGTSGCEIPSNFVFEIGEHFAIVDALNKLDELVSYHRQEQMTRSYSRDHDHNVESAVTIGTGGIVSSGSISIEVIEQATVEAQEMVERILSGMKKKDK